jgi:hypothetical protein
VVRPGADCASLGIRLQEHLWADRFDGGLENIFDLQDQVTASVIGAISPKLDSRPRLNGPNASQPKILMPMTATCAA